MIWLLLMLFIPGGLNQVQNPFGTGHQSIAPCGNSRVTVTSQSPTLYNLDIRIPSGTTNLTLKFNSKAAVTLNGPYSTGIFWDHEELHAVKDTYFFMIYPGRNSRFNAQVGRPHSGIPEVVPIRSILADNQELCKYPLIGYFDFNILDGDSAETSPREPLDKSCGRRKVVHTELVVHGQPSKSGDWPWHVAISRIERSILMYICGGTLLSETLVLTAAHCVAISGNRVLPESLSVGLGKYNLIGGDIASQERKVFQIIVHPKFNGNTLTNDIALLKLKTEAVFSDYVQPACLWLPDNKLTTEEVFGTVVGWGFNHQDLLSPTLQQITIPIVSELNCLRSNPTFFNMKLNINKFCAGFANGTSACNGDSGGGLMIFVPDTPGDTSQASGSWYVRGIVSLSPRKYEAPICDPDQYTIFTDVERYKDWLTMYLN